MNEKIRCLKEQLKQLNIEGMIVSNPVSIKYLTNIDVEGVLLITRRENVFLTYTMYIEDVNRTLTINDEVVVMDFREIILDEYEKFFLFCENVGFEEGYVTYDEYKNIKRKYKVNNLAETDGIIEKQRIIKDDDEINNIKRACEITDDCFSHLLTFIKQGITEREIAIEIEMYFKKRGIEELAFTPIVAVGENSAIPHWKPSDRAVKPGDPILIDMGCKYKGYASDMTRTIFMGCILEEIKAIYDLVLKNQMAVLEEVRENSNIKMISQRVIQDFRKHNFSLIHSLGHGVGLETHERPYINTKYDKLLKNNTVIAIEPGIYIPGKYGIRIEDTALVTKNGCILLTKSEKNYTVI